jgi:hypothetical protein
MMAVAQTKAEYQPYRRIDSPLIFDLPPWFINVYGAELRTLEWSNGEAKRFLASFTGGMMRRVTLIATDFAGKLKISPGNEADRSLVFREEFLRAPL